jgi:hypothetical protein
MQTVPIYPGAQNIKTWQMAYNSSEASPWNEAAGISYSAPVKSRIVEMYYEQWFASDGWVERVPGTSTNGIAVSDHEKGRNYFDGFDFLGSRWPWIKHRMGSDFRLHMVIPPTSPLGTKVEVTVYRLRPVPQALPPPPTREPLIVPNALPTP